LNRNKKIGESPRGEGKRRLHEKNSMEWWDIRAKELEVERNSESVKESRVRE